MEVINKNRIIVTGQMRSGTTMLCSFLDSQNKITVFQDFLRVAIAAMIIFKPTIEPDQKLSSDQKRKLINEFVRITLKNGVRPGDFRGLEWDIVNDINEADEWPDFYSIADLYTFLLDRLVIKAEIDQGILTGTKVTRSEDLARVCSERGMKAIIILRDPRATFVSLFLRAQHDPDFKVNTDVQRFINSWRKSFRIWKKSGNFLPIRYEDFVLDPALGGKLAAYLERDINPNALIDISNSSFGDESTGKVRSGTVDRWREHADPTHIGEILEGLAGEMIEAGYL